MRKCDEAGGRGVTRREFVKSSAAAASIPAVGILAHAGVARSAWAGGSDTVRVGLVGCGGRGSGAAEQALKADEGVLLTAMGDAFMDRVETSRRALRTRYEDRVKVADADLYAGFDAYRQVIDSGVDVVLLATPPVFRPEHLAYAIEKDKHVFCEKPMAVDAPGVRSVLESAALAKRKRLSLVSGFCWRYNAAQRETYERIHEGQIGEVRTVQSTYNAGPLGDVARKPGWSDMEWQLRNWKAFIWASGDHIVEQAVHAIDWIAWALKGELPARAVAVGGRQCRSGEWTGDMYDHFGVTYEFESGARGYHMCRQIAGCSNDNTAYITGTKGTCFSNPWSPGSIRIDGERPWTFTGRNNDMYQQEHDELFASIRAGEAKNDGEWMAHSTMMGILGRMCAYTGQTITWEQAMKSEERLAPESWTWGELAFPDVPMPGQTKFE